MSALSYSPIFPGFPRQSDTRVGVQVQGQNGWFIACKVTMPAHNIQLLSVSCKYLGSTSRGTKEKCKVELD